VAARVSCSGPVDVRSAAARPEGVRDDRSRGSEKTDDLGPIIAAYGRPDLDDSTAYEKPRPPIPSRWIEYRPENVKIF